MAANAAERIGETFALILASSFKKQSVCMVVEVYFTRMGVYFTIICSCGARGYQEKLEGKLEVPQFSPVLPPIPAPRAEFQKLRWLGFPLTLHCFALFNHNQVSLFCSVQSGLRPIYATQSHPKTLLPAHIQSL